MPYTDNRHLPPAVQRASPRHAQDIYRAAFNNAFAAHTGEQDKEERAHRIAWAAVKRQFVKRGERWVERG